MKRTNLHWLKRHSMKLQFQLPSHHQIQSPSNTNQGRQQDKVLIDLEAEKIPTVATLYANIPAVNLPNKEP